MKSDLISYWPDPASKKLYNVTYLQAVRPAGKKS